MLLSFSSASKFMSPERRIPQQPGLSQQESRIRRLTALPRAEVDKSLKMSTNNSPNLHKLYNDPINRDAALTVADAWRRMNDGEQGAMKRARRQLGKELPPGRIEELKPLFKLVKRMYRPSGSGPSRGWARHVRKEKSAANKA